MGFLLLNWGGGSENYENINNIFIVDIFISKENSVNLKNQHNSWNKINKLSIEVAKVKIKIENFFTYYNDKIKKKVSRKLYWD